MAVADAGSASGATATSPARRTQAVRGLSLTTPAQFRLAAAVLVVGLAVLGLVGGQVALERADAVEAVADDATPMLVGAEELYVALADADAAASSAFLRALEPPDLRAKYRTRIAEANAWLTKIAAEPDLSPESRAAVTRIAETLPAYTGEIEAARANDRWGYPVGAAHLRGASNAMVDTILPAATSVYDDAARQLYDAYGDGTSRAHPQALVAVGASVLALLLATQVLVTWRSRRLLNVGLLGATLLVAALGTWTLVRIDGQGSALVRSQREGSDQLIVLSRARILALRSLSDDNLRLIERGTDTSDLEEDFAAVTTMVGGTDGSGGLLGTAAGLAARTGSTTQIERIRQQWTEYMAVHARVRELDDAGEYRDAVELAVSDQAAAQLAVDQGLDSEITLAEARLRTSAADASRHLRWLAATVAVTVLVAALLVVTGLWVRFKEYR
jgi:hypothetical protein